MYWYCFMEENTINLFFAGSKSNCRDAQDSQLANTIPNIWHKSQIKRSNFACDVENKKRFGKYFFYVTIQLWNFINRLIIT